MDSYVSGLPYTKSVKTESCSRGTRGCPLARPLFPGRYQPHSITCSLRGQPCAVRLGIPRIVRQHSLSRGSTSPARTRRRASTRSRFRTCLQFWKARDLHLAAPASLAALRLRVPEDLSELRGYLSLCVWVERCKPKVASSLVMRKDTVHRATVAVAQHKPALRP